MSVKKLLVRDSHVVQIPTSTRPLVNAVTRAKKHVCSQREGVRDFMGISREDGQRAVTSSTIFIAESWVRD